MYYLIYLSAATRWFTETELNDILAVSQVNNARDDITGLLLYGDGNFIQLLEGEEAMVQKAFERISTDGRHNSITHITGGALQQRNFSQWAMGFKTMETARLSRLKTDLTNKTANKQGHVAINLLNAFIKSARL